MDLKKRWLNWTHSGVPDHTQESFENYVMYGYSPGGFLTAALENNFALAAARADHVNKEHLAELGRWLMCGSFPGMCWGSPEAVRDWLDDKDNRRTEYATHMEKKRMWETLKETA